MKHIYNPTAAITQRSTANALGTAMVSKFFMLLLLGFFLLVSGESFGQNTTIYPRNEFNNLDNIHIQTVSGQIELASNRIRAYTATGNKAYNGYIAISGRTFKIKKGFTYTVSFNARAVNHQQGGDGNISILRANSANTNNVSEIDWSSSSASVLGSGVILKNASTSMAAHTITFKALDEFDSQYLAIRLSTSGGNQSELYFDRLTISETCTPTAPQAVSKGSCSINVPITLTASGAENGIEIYRWYTQASGGTAILNENGAQYTTPSLPQTTDYYVSIYSSETKCESSRVRVTATVGGLPTPNVVMTTGSCDSNGNETNIYTASGGSDGDYRWYSVTISGTDTTLVQLNTSNNQPISSSTLSRKANSEEGLYAARIVGTGCESKPKYFRVDRGNIGAPTGATGAICGNQLTLRATGANLGESYNWYATVNEETTFIGRAANLVIAAPSVSTVYTVSRINIASGCESASRITAVVNTFSLNQPNSIAGNQTVCQGRIETYSVPSVTGATYAWTIVPAPADGSAPMPVATLANATTNQVRVTYPNGAYRGTLRVTVSNPCNSYTSELAVQASNNNVATGDLVEPVNPVIGRPETYGFTSNIDDDLIVDLVWSYRRTNSSEWIVTPSTTSRTFTFESMPGDLNGVRVEIQVMNPGANCITGISATNTFFIGNDQIIPLPVELISFKAQRHTKGVNLTWVTASELDNKGFEVQVSANAIDFTVIGFVESKLGTTSSKQYYNYIDTKAVSGTRYYRLKQVDFDGTSSYSPIKAVALDGYSANVSAYPNPFDDVVVVTLNGSEARTVQVVLLDAMGKVLQQRMEETAGNSISVDMASVKTKGMYILHVLDNDMKHTFKLMKR
ncbi:T9SS type A sorting domain-containing protein [Pontibacter sp. BAB1700]|uniref:Ig-like domain-containing protein n=1 Tax=Pontibacter sp. BAB1700 TaxID=1144253 RepID=UPI001ED926D2|nr:T9SS type A sorting domain-containing protein [Pontibacter sp. BAB1700]